MIALKIYFDVYNTLMCKILETPALKFSEKQEKWMWVQDLIS